MDREYFLYVGTYQRDGSRGIHCFLFDAVSGRLQQIGTLGDPLNPSFLVTHPRQPVLYAVSDVTGDSEEDGWISSFAIDAEAGALSLLDRRRTAGGGACYLSLDEAGTSLIAAHYFSGGATVLEVREDGRLGDIATWIRHQGHSVHPKRQTSPHPHAAVFSPDGRFILVPDLGLDQVLCYRFDSTKRSLTPGRHTHTTVAANSGPRHLVFHPNGAFAYLISELCASVTVFSYQVCDARLVACQTAQLSLMQPTGTGGGAGIEIDARGSFLYTSNRADQSISVFQIADDGMVEEIERRSSGGLTPRSIQLDPSGSWLFVANQDSNTVVVFPVDARTGRLGLTRQTTIVHSPACFAFCPRRSKAGPN